MSDNKKSLVKSVEAVLRDTFKEELAKDNDNRIAIVKNLDIYKRVKLSYSGKGLLPEDFIAIENLLYPRLPWESEVKSGFATEEEASTLHILAAFVIAHSSLTVRAGVSTWFKESEVKNEESDFITEIKPILNSLLTNFQLLFSQNIVEMEKYLASLINGKDRRIALRENRALINVFDQKEIKDYVYAKHEEIHLAVKGMKDFEITSSYERDRKITIYKNISAILNEYLIYANFLREMSTAWQQHNYYYSANPN